MTRAEALDAIEHLLSTCHAGSPRGLSETECLANTEDVADLLVGLGLVEVDASYRGEPQMTYMLEALDR